MQNVNKRLMVTNGGYRNAGLFSYVGQVIGNLHVADITNTKMYINLPHTPYHEPQRGKNSWDYYFIQPFNITEEDLTNYDIIDEQEWFDGKLDTIKADLIESTILRAREITKKYIKPVPLIAEKILKFQEEIIKTNNYASIHYRGTDHHYGTPNGTYPLIPQEIYLQYIEQLLTKFDKVVVCSDQQDFINKAVQLFGPDNVVFYNSIRSTNHIAIHYNNEGAKYQTGEDVVVESYLMSESKYLVRTCSGVTHFSIFNSQDPDFKFVNIDDHYYSNYKK
jgi:hypothetical protein